MMSHAILPSTFVFTVASNLPGQTLRSNHHGHSVSTSKRAGLIASVSLADSIHALISSDETRIEHIILSDKRAGFVASASFAASLNTFLASADDSSERTTHNDVLADSDLPSASASLSSIASSLDSYPPVFDKPCPVLDAIQFEARAAGSQRGEAWWTLPYQRPARIAGLSNSPSNWTLETVSNILTSESFESTDSVAAYTAPPPPSYTAPGPTLTSAFALLSARKLTHSEQLACLYTAARDTGAPLSRSPLDAEPTTLLDFISNDPHELFPAPMPVDTRNAAARALQAFGRAVLRIIN
jgi:hypothetical protein